MKSRKGAAVFFPPPLIFLIAIAVGFFLEREAYPLVNFIEGKMLGLGWALIVLSLLLLKLAMQKFKDTNQEPEPWKESPQLIVEGIYLYTRNPMYLAMAFFQLGVGLNMENLWVVAITPLSLVLVYYIAVRPEERYLEKKFGDSYLSYRSKVNRWI